MARNLIGIIKGRPPSEVIREIKIEKCGMCSYSGYQYYTDSDFTTPSDMIVPEW